MAFDLEFFEAGVDEFEFDFFRVGSFGDGEFDDGFA